MKDNRNLKAKGVSNKSFNAKDMAKRAKQAEKRAEQANSKMTEEV